MSWPEPSESNEYLACHIKLLRSSLRRWTGRDMVDPALNGAEAAKEVSYSPIAVVSHGTEADPVFNYGNRAALELFEMTWDEFTRLPSRQSAESVSQEGRNRLLAEVAENGFIDHYSGVRISKSGRRFIFESAIVWNILDERGVHHGQAAMFKHWLYL